MIRTRTLLTATLLASVALGGCGLDVDADHTVAASAPEPLADRGPALGTYQQEWRVTAEFGKERATYRVAGGNLVMATETGVYAHDARTGRPSWHYREPGRTLRGLAESDGAIVLSTARLVPDNGSEDVTDPHVVGLDAATGEQLWEATEDWEILAGDIRAPSAPLTWGDAAAGVVLVSVKPSSERAGVKARTGEKVWQVSGKEAAEDCTAETGRRGAGPILVIRPTCDQSADAIVALDAESDEPPKLLTPGGEDLFTAPAGSECLRCELLLTGERALLTYTLVKPATEMMVSVDLRTGQAIPVEGWTPKVGDMRAVAGRRLYEVRHSVGPEGLARTVLPAGLTVTDPANGRQRTLPLPFASPSLTPRNGEPVWLGVAGDRLLLATIVTDPLRSADPVAAPVITSYTLAGTAQPLELGGVPVADWPDPCRLLAGLPAETGVTSELDPGESLTIGDVTLPRVWCVATQGDSDGIGVQVLWVTRTEREAAELTKGLPAGQAKIVRVGRVIVSVLADVPELRDPAVRTVVRNLRVSQR